MVRRVREPRREAEEQEGSGEEKESDRSDSLPDEQVLREPVMKLIVVDEYRSHPTNPRKVFKELEELGQSLKKQGQIEPIVVTPEKVVVVGERRFRAAKLVGLTHLLAIVRELTEQQILELQIAENNQRADVHPLEEADAFTRLHALYSVHIVEVAAKAGRSVAYIRHRMRLATLHDKVKEAFLGDKLGAQAMQVAFYLSRIPQEFQPDALKAILAMGVNGEITAARVQTYLLGQYTLRLETAPFDPKDSKLLPTAGACTACPKRSGNDPLLFPEIQAKETCTDPICFGAKRRASYAKREQFAIETGRRVMTQKECSQVFERDRLRIDAPYVDLDAQHFEDDPDPKKCRTWRAIFGQKQPQTVLARDEYGAAHDLLPREEFLDALKAAGAAKEVKWLRSLQDAAKGTEKTTTKDGLDKAIAEKQKAEVAALREAVDASLLHIVAECDIRAPGDAEVWQFVLRGVLESTWDETAKDVAVRRGLLEKKAKKSDAKDALLALLTRASAKSLRNAVVELIAARSAFTQGLKSESFARACQVFGVDFKANLKEARKATQPERPKAKPGKPKGTGKRGRPRKKSDRSDFLPPEEDEEESGPPCRVCRSRGGEVVGDPDKPQICVACDGLEDQIEDAILYLGKSTENAVCSHFADDDRGEDDYTVGVFDEERTASAIADLKAQGRIREDGGFLKTKKRAEKPTKFRRSAKVR